MNNRPLLTESDRCRLGWLLTADATRGVAPRQLRDELEWRVETAEAVMAEAIPDDVVTMNSTIRLVSMNSKAEIVGTVVYPEDVEVVDHGVSVLDPLGTRLIGCEIGDLIECEDQNDPGPWRVAEILYQPERSGAFHL